MQNSKFKVDLKARCYKFSLNIITLTDALPNKHSSRIIANQLIRAATSMQMQRLILRPSWGQTPRLAQIFMKFHGYYGHRKTIYYFIELLVKTI